jgi:hypothetical protein
LSSTFKKLEAGTGLVLPRRAAHRCRVCAAIAHGKMPA